VLFCDGSVCFFGEHVSPDVLKRLLTATGGVHAEVPDN
jgi:hypothetical protein